MLGPKTHSHIEAHLKLTFWNVEPFVVVMQETSKHDPISKTHSMLSLSGTWCLSRLTECTNGDIENLRRWRYRNVRFYKNEWHDLQYQRLLRGQGKYRRQIHLGQRPWRSYHASRLVRVQWNNFSWSRFGYYRECWNLSGITLNDCR